MANQMNKMMTTLAVGGMIAGLAACGGSPAQPETGAGPAAGTEAHSCKGDAKGGEASCSANGKCGGHKEAAPADGAAAAPAPADAPK